MVSCWYHSGFPTSLEWWIINVVSIIMMALLGEFLCMKREMQEIPLFPSTLGGPGYSRVGRRNSDPSDGV